MHMKKCITIHVLLGNIRPRFRYRIKDADSLDLHSTSCWGPCSAPSTQMYCAMTNGHCTLCLRHNTHPRPRDKKARLGGGRHYSGCLPSSFTPTTPLFFDQSVVKLIRPWTCEVFWGGGGGLRCSYLQNRNFIG